MTYEFIISEKQGRVGVITLNRPKQMNALNAQVMQELAKALYAFDADEGVGCILITARKALRRRRRPSPREGLSYMGTPTRPTTSRAIGSTSGASGSP